MGFILWAGLIQAVTAECPCVSNGLPQILGENVPSDHSGIDASEYYVERILSDGSSMYLQGAYGGSCDDWEMEYDIDCKGQTYVRAYCLTPWCYVEPADCGANMNAQNSLFFPNTNLHYSYEKCGSQDAYTAVACRPKSQSACVDPCAWNAGGGPDGNGICQTIVCKCSGVNTGIDASKYGTNYGKYCDAWENTKCAEHWGPTSTESTTLGLWCCRKWCYVPESCPSKYPSNLVAGLFYSYFNCPDDLQLLRVCTWQDEVNFRDEASNPYTILVPIIAMLVTL